MVAPKIDTCRTCPFARHILENGAEPRAVCTLRDRFLSDPGATVCNNHPSYNPLRVRTPRGPVWSLFDPQDPELFHPNFKHLPPGLRPPRGTTHHRLPWFHDARPVCIGGGTCAVCSRTGTTMLALDPPREPLRFCSARHYLDAWLEADPAVRAERETHGHGGHCRDGDLGPILAELRAVAQEPLDPARVRTALEGVDAWLVHHVSGAVDLSMVALVLKYPQFCNDLTMDMIHLWYDLAHAGRLLDRHPDPQELLQVLASLIHRLQSFHSGPSATPRHAARTA